MEEEKDLQFRLVIDSCFRRVLEKLDPIPLLDRMIDTSFDTRAELCDIRESGTITEKNRKIMDLFRLKGPNHFQTFLDLLKQSGNASVAEMLTHKALLHQLLDLYQTMCSWENPITADQQYTSDMYVPPAVKLIRVKDEHGGLVEVKKEQSKSSLLTYQQVFSSPTGPCKNIYITGDAGTGKTTFCNQLVLTWCKAVQNVQDGTVSAEDLELLSDFKFLFYIALRDAETIYHVEDMINKQLLHNYCITVDISYLLKTEKCLIVLDGLDEWSTTPDCVKCPGLNKHLPGRNLISKTCVFLTTTRNWKFDVIDLKSKDLDKCVELCGFTSESSKELAQRVVDVLNRNSQSKRKVEDFYNVIHEKGLTGLITQPVLFIQLINLWYFDMDIGISQVHLYCTMLDLMFKHSEKYLPDKQLEKTCETREKRGRLPDCFSTKYYCQIHTELLLCLARLAYKSLFNMHEEDSLVFKSSKLDLHGISHSDIILCLQSGILSQEKDYEFFTGRYKKFSFLHQRIHEFFAALHIATVDRVEDVLKDPLEFCNSVEIVIDMAQVWLSVCGIRPDLTGQISEHFTKVFNADSQVHNYRQRLGGEGRIRDMQTCLTDCLREVACNGYTHTSISLDDFYIDNDTVGHLETFFQGTVMSQIKSLYINTKYTTDNQLKAITEFLPECKAVEKLHLYNRQETFPIEVTASVIQNCCDYLTCLDLDRLTLTCDAVTAVCHSSSTCLKALKLCDVSLKHADLERLLNKLSQSSAMRQLHLVSLNCTDHPYPSYARCSSTCRIDLSSMTRLQSLYLHYMHVENLQNVSQCVEDVYLYNVTLPVTSVCELSRAISQTERDMTVRLRGITVTLDLGALEAFVRSCCGTTLTECQYEDSDKTWYIDFHSGSQ